jgi:hypothetical protein
MRTVGLLTHNLMTSGGRKVLPSQGAQDALLFHPANALVIL